MGSPSTEHGRDDDEVQHEVILTRGFWPAETACTQALWEAVTGKDPSPPKGEQRLAERFSWGDVHFCESIEKCNISSSPCAARILRPTASGSMP